MLTVAAIERADAVRGAAPWQTLVLAHDERLVRRRTFVLGDGSTALLDLAEPTLLRAGDHLVLEDGRRVAIAAADEALLEVSGRDAAHLVELAWHIGNRHLAAAIDAERIFILRDHVIAAMLKGLGATVAEVAGPFDPARGAYAGHGHSHDHPAARSNA